MNKLKPEDTSPASRSKSWAEVLRSSAPPSLSPSFAVKPDSVPTVIYLCRMGILEFSTLGAEDALMCGAGAGKT
jgi:hypothetical protein